MHMKFVVGFHQAEHIIGHDSFLGRLVGGFHLFQKQGAVPFNGNIDNAHLDQGFMLSNIALVFCRVMGRTITPFLG
jgi:hypothetical protein